jgi:hypothetical protein
MVRPLSMKERGEIIGLALDISADVYNEFLKDESVFAFKGSASDKRVAAAIDIVYQAVEEDYRKEHEDMFLSIWGRSILYKTKHGGDNILKVFPNRKKAQAEFNKN